MSQVVLGFYAASKYEQIALCHGDSLVVVKSKKDIKRLLGDDESNFNISKMKHKNLLKGIDMGGVYDLDKDVFTHFSRLININLYSVKEEHNYETLFFTISRKSNATIEI